jgi:FKBP-type peptidyl-prolyl cis-trans isomerase FkpA
MRTLSFFVICIALIAYAGCNKSTPQNNSCTNALPFSDSTALLKFAGDTIQPVMDSTGLFYQIMDSGGNVHPTVNSQLLVTYYGKLMNGTQFTADSNSYLNNSTLGQLIIGWQLGLEKIGKGGHIKLLIPSAYAWGCLGNQGVAPDQPVYFDIWLLDLQ